MKPMYTRAILLLSIITWGCGGKPPEPSRIGVFADTGSMVELTSYAKRSSSGDYQAPDQAQVPEAARVNSFYVNMPDVIITESKIVWVGVGAFKMQIDVGAFKTQIDVRAIDEGKLEILETQIEKTSGGVYKVSSAALQSKTGGIVGLKVVLPLGTADRIYWVKLK